MACRNNLAVACYLSGRLDEAISLYEQTLTDCEQAYGDTHQHTLTSRNNLALAYQRAGRLDEAIPLLESALADREQALGRTNRDTLQSRSNLGLAYQEAGRLAEAIPLQERTLADYEQMLGHPHPDTGRCRNNLALSYMAARRLDEAIPLFEHSLADHEQALGRSHPQTLAYRNNLAGAYNASGQASQAIELYEQVLADSERGLGDIHPQTLTCRSNLALSYLDAGRLDEAIPLLERTLAGRSQTLGDTHPDTITSRANLSSAYHDAGRLAEAERLRDAPPLTYRSQTRQGDSGTPIAHDIIPNMRKDLRESPEYAAVAEHVRQLHEPAFGQPHRVTDLVMTADASRIVVTGSVYDELEGLPRTALYEVRDGGLTALTAAGGSAKSGRLAPDGSTLAFLSDRAKAGVFQLYLLADGQFGEARPAPAVPGTVEYLAWSPDGTQILLGVAGLGAEMADAQGSGTAGPGSDAARELPAWYPEVEAGTPEDAWRSLWLYETATAKLSRKSPEGLNVWEAAWSGPAHILAVTSAGPSEDDWYSAVLSRIEVSTGEVTELLRSDVQLGLPAGTFGRTARRGGRGGVQ